MTVSMMIHLGQLPMCMTAFHSKKKDFHDNENQRDDSQQCKART